MAVFIEITTDAFEQALNDQKSKKSRENRSSRAGRRVARRPTRGLEIKDDTAAAIKIIQADGTELPLVDSSSPDGETTSGYANFILQSVQEQRMEKHQIVETFGESYIFFFGENPRFLNVQCVLINSHDFNWEAEWWENYERYFRGTRLVELGARLYMFYDDNIVEGYMLNSQAVKVSEEPFLIRMNFLLFVTNYRNVSFIGNPNFPIRASVHLPPGVSLTSGRAAGDLIDKYRGAAQDQVRSQSSPVEGQQLSDLINEDGFGQKTRLSTFLRSVPPSLAIAPDVLAKINSIADTVEGINLHELAERTGKPLRSLIANNIDEYVGADGSTYFGFEPGQRVPTALAPAIRSQIEVQDLFKAATDFLSCYGADINNPSAMRGLGLGARIDVSVGATFRPAAQGSFGFGLGGETTAASEFDRFSQDPLGAVYGRSEVDERQKDNRFVQGAGDSGYGFTSDFAAGPGFGAAGFDLYGGAGFGSGQGAGGDPGFQNPSRFSFAGAADNRSAFQRFLKPKEDASRFGTGIGLGAATTGLTGSASFTIGGSVSAFAIASVGGELDLTGGARTNPANVSARAAAQANGFQQDNPFGTVCASPTGIIQTTSTGVIGFAVGGGVSAGGSAGVSFSLP